MEKKLNNVDVQYHNLVKDIMDNGYDKDTRSGKVRSLFGKLLEFDLKNGFPILTTKKMFVKGVIYELLSFLNGYSNIKYLVDNNVHIWDDDAYRWYSTLYNKYHFDNKKYSKEEFIDYIKTHDKSKLDYIIISKCGPIPTIYTYGDLGPVYGHQWRDCNGIDQIGDIINNLINNPDDRRMICNSWNVSEIENMALPPCHYSFQFYTRKLNDYEKEKYSNDNFKPERELSLMWNQRSVDVGLGLPFNITSYALLLILMAKRCNMIPGKLKGCLGDCHIYKNHFDGLKEQLSRDVNKFNYPIIEIQNITKDLKNMKYEDFKIQGYESYNSIKLPLSVG